MDPWTVIFAILAGLGFAWGLWLMRDRYRLLAERDVARARLSDEDGSRRDFRALADEALRSSNEQFLRLAKETLAARENHAVAEIDKRRLAVDELVQPIRAALEKTKEEMQRVEKGNTNLLAQVSQMQTSNQALREETGKLTQALRKPNVRGRYGEIQLERVVELAGMRSYCDFTAQGNLRDDEGNLYKPDLIVRLPNERIIAIDAKTSIDAYLDALDAETAEEREALLDRYADNVYLQAQKLSRKEYFRHFDSSPEFVVMFIPGDQLVDAALERRPELIEQIAAQNVVIASPSTLIGLLRAVHVGWREKSLSENAKELFQLGRELHERATVALDHAGRVGTALNKAKESYNSFVASVDRRLIPTLRKFEEKGARSSKTLATLPTVEGEAQQLSSATLTPVTPTPATQEKAKSDLKPVPTLDFAEEA